MTRKRYMALHTFHSDKSKEAFQARNLGNTSTQREWAEAWTFEKCQCVATWVGDDDFFFCHWLAESDQDVHEALTSMGLDEFIFTACYEAPMHIDVNFLSDKPAFQQADSNVTVNA
jgi:hypothetical protein